MTIRIFALLAGTLAAFTAVSHGQQASIGVNLTGEWLWADAVRQARPHWDTAVHLGDGSATVDSNNWPTQDCSLLVWEGHAYNEGTYGLSFNGKATVAVSYGYGTVDGAASGPGAYDAATNTTTAKVVITDTSKQNCSLIFTNTQRTAASATNTGITNVHFYRPVSEGATTSYAPGTLFTNQTLALSAKFSVTRFMDLVGANGSTQVNWSDRPLPGAWHQNPLAYEYAVAYGNATNADIYLNVPLSATSAYVTNLARLIKYGSDGVNPYSSTQAHPAYAPLDPKLHVYLEYSNEVWNGGFQQAHGNYDAVAADQSANNAEWSILNFDGAVANNLWTGAWRRIIYEAKLISDGFRAVYGDAAMPPNANATVRPLIEFQADNGQATGSTQLQFLDCYFNNSDGVNHVPTPHPVNYFLWGGGGATYYGSNKDNASTVDELFGSGIPNATYAAMTQIDTALVKGYGLKRVAYEGGWAVYNGTNGYTNTPDTAAAQAKFDARATAAETSAQTIFQQAGGDLNIFYTSSNWAPTYVWGMTDQIFNLGEPLFQAVSAIDAAAPPAINYGNAISGTVATTLDYASRLFSENNYNSGLSDDGGIGFVPLVSAAGNYRISLMINAASAGRSVRVLVDGQMLGGTISVPVSNSPVNVDVGVVNLTAGQHGLIVEGQYTSNNSYSGNSCSFTSATLTPLPLPQVTGPPQNAKAALGGTASFSVTATGNGLTYQWQFDGVAISGQTAATLVLTNVGKNQAGNYNVLVTNEAGTVASATATLTITQDYTHWAKQYFSAQQQTNANISGPGAIPQKDGVSNLLKYFFDIDPSRPMTTADRTALPIAGVVVAGGKEYVTLTYRRNALLTGVVFHTQTSPDLQAWTDFTNPATAQTGIDAVTGDPIWQIKVPVSGSKAFIRLNVRTT